MHWYRRATYAVSGEFGYRPAYRCMDGHVFSESHYLIHKEATRDEPEDACDVCPVCRIEDFGPNDAPVVVKAIWRRRTVLTYSKTKHFHVRAA